MAQKLENQKMKNEKHHVHITFTALTILIQITTIAIIIYMAQNIIILQSEIHSLNDTQLRLNEKQLSFQDQLNDISNSLLSTKKDLTTQFNELKAQTSSDFSGVIQDVIPAVVSVSTDVAQGSGFIILNDGYVVTNAHVLSGGSYVRVLTYESTKWKTAKLIGVDDAMDIAVLKIDGSYNPLEFENSDNLKVGEKVIALGNPLGLSFSVSEGIISGLKREGPNMINAYIQIDTPLNRGNSGGPLVNKAGKVVGVNNFKIAGSENVGFALESNYVKESADAIIANA